MGTLPTLNLFKATSPDLAQAMMSAETVRGQQVRNALAGKQLENYDKDRNYLMKKRGWEEEDRERALKKHKFKDEVDALTYLQKSAPMITYDNYQESKKHFEDLGLNPNLLPPIEKFGPVGSDLARKAFDEGKTQFLLSVDNQIKLLEKSKKNKTQVTIYGPGGKTKKVAVNKTEDYTPPKGWSLTAPKTKAPRRPAQIKKEIVALEKTRAEAIANGALSAAGLAMLASVDPELAEKSKKVDISELIAAIDDAHQELLKELPAGSRPKKKTSTKQSWKKYVTPQTTD